MIYTKIYVTKNLELVFDSVKEDVGLNCILAGEKIDTEFEYEDPFDAYSYWDRTTIYPASGVAISPEAKKLLTDLIDTSNPNFVVSRFSGDFEFYSDGPDYLPKTFTFAFTPEEGSTMRVLKPTDKFTVHTGNGFSLATIDNFTVTSNEFLEKLDISKPISKQSLPKI